MSEMGPKTKVSARPLDVCFAPMSGHRQAAPACPKSADSVAKVVLQKVSKILRAAGALFV
jgi:hypothetical protein